jgi:adenine-specific DNA-methyltransferase
MAEKGNDRSNAKISDKDILRILNAKGKVKVFSQNYKAFSTGKSSIEANQERLFVCKCFNAKELIQSPLNYTGGKFKLLNQILPLFPQNVDTFVDLFCGGANVGINVNAKNVIFNDISPYLTCLLNTFNNLDKDIVFDMIDEIIDKYKLSRTDKLGYGFYNCDSNRGLGEYNKDKFLCMRKDFNAKKNQDYYYFILLYVLITYSFNNQIRFNSKGEFNLPVGKRDFNEKMQLKLSKFIDRLKANSYKFTELDFRNFPVDNLTENSLVYVDPPYLITCATYNENNGWGENDEKDLLEFLNDLHSKNIKFALSNVLKSKNKENKILLKWLKKNNDKYRAINLNYSYSNSNYQTKDKTSRTEEVLIVNY